MLHLRIDETAGPVRRARLAPRAMLLPAILAATFISAPLLSALDRETAVRVETQLAALVALADTLSPRAREEINLRVATLRGLLASVQPAQPVQPVQPVQPIQPARRMAVPDADMPGILAKLRDAWPFDGQRRYLTLYATNRSFGIAQIRDIVAVISFSQDRREILALLLPNARDPENIDLLYGMYWTRDDKDYLHSLLGIR